jgi:hypothetical protein
MSFYANYEEKVEENKLVLSCAKLRLSCAELASKS